jgi:flagellar P-ring protein precursor FlgI
MKHYITLLILLTFGATQVCANGDVQVKPTAKDAKKAPIPAHHPVDQGIRIKDIVNFEGVRDNQLVGYGLVVGLNKTGDSLNSNPFTQESLVSMLERLGVNIRGKPGLSGQNVAAVMVTADLPPFSRTGSRLDVSVSSIGSAKDLRGGVLLVTPLLAADGEVYAVAQGPVANGGFAETGKSGTSVTKGVPTSGRIANGAIIEREIGFELKGQKALRLALKNPDFTTAKRIADVINTFTKGTAAIPLDPNTVNLTVPAHYHETVMTFMSEIEQLRVRPDQTARVIVDEQNGIIVMGENVRISPVAVSHGNLTIKIKEAKQVSQPNPFAERGQTRVVDRSDIEIDEGGADKKMTIISGTVSLQDLVNALNALGVSPMDMITIMHAIKAAGALQADIEVM